MKTTQRMLGGAAIGVSDPNTDVMPITTTLGSLAAWLGGMALTAGAFFASSWIAGQRQRDPVGPLAVGVLE